MRHGWEALPVPLSQGPFAAVDRWHSEQCHDRTRALTTPGGVERDVTIEDADDAINDAVEAAYRTKYQRYAGSIVDGITNDEARSTTLKLVPRA